MTAADCQVCPRLHSPINTLGDPGSAADARNSVGIHRVSAGKTTSSRSGWRAYTGSLLLPDHRHREFVQLFFFLAHLAVTALRPCLLRSSWLSFAALALPPLLPRATAWGFLPFFLPFADDA